MKPSLEHLERCASESGYSIAPLEKVVRLGEMAAHINGHPFLGEVLVLKGGTPFDL